MRRCLLGASLALAGCTAAQGLVASPRDYAAYRATRVAPTLEARLTAAQRYLEEHPTGFYTDEVRGSFEPAEEVFYEAKKGSRAGLLAYLAALPRGPHRDDAMRRIDVLDAAERVKRAEVARAQARATGAAAAQRKEVREELERWLARFLERAVFKAPFAEASGAVLVPYTLNLPAPRCELVDPPEGAVARRCAKVVELPYSVEVDRDVEPREAIVEIALVEDERGVPLEVTLSGSGLFVRLEETYRVRPLSADNAEHRAAAAARAVELLKAVFSRVVSDDPACQRRASPPASLVLACAGIHVTLSAGATPAEDDRVVIVPVL